MKLSLIVADALCLLNLSVLSSAAGPSMPIRDEVIIKRTASAWESQQVQEPCILPNPKDPARLVMFYSGVPADEPERMLHWQGLGLQG